MPIFHKMRGEGGEGVGIEKEISLIKIFISSTLLISSKFSGPVATSIGEQSLIDENKIA